MSENDLSPKASPCENCSREVPLPAFDLEACRGLTPYQVRDKFPRLDHVCLCGSRTIVYHSYAHYIAGDW